MFSNTSLTTELSLLTPCLSSNKRFELISNKEYNNYEIELHKAAQVLALTSINFQEELPDDSQNTLSLGENSLMARRFELEERAYKIFIDLAELQLVLTSLDSHFRVVQPLVNVDFNQVISTWKEWLVELGYKGPVKTTPHYELPESDVYQNGRVGALIRKFTAQWHKNRSLAGEVLNSLNRATGQSSEVNIWPHHFDTAVYYVIAKDGMEDKFSIGAGLAMADSMIDEPYFYIYGYSRDSSIQYDAVPGLEPGKWLTDEWQGAVCELRKVDSGKQVLDQFFIPAFEFLNKQKNI